MDDLKIDYCYECKTWSYRYNYQRCPICSDKIAERERQRDKERLKRLKMN